MKTNDDLQYWVTLSLIPDVGRVKFSRMENYFGSTKRTWEAPLTGLKHAGLNDGFTRTIVAWRPKISPEADKSSGAIITALLALEQNRQVFIILSSILSVTSRRTNRFIQKGAKLAYNYADIMEKPNLTTSTHQKEIIPSSDTETLLLKQLSTAPTHVDEICRSSNLPISTVSSTLVMMEFNGLIKQVAPMNYSQSCETRQGYRVKVD